MTKIYKSYEVIGVECSVIHNNREPVLLLDVETPSYHLNGV